MSKRRKKSRPDTRVDEAWVIFRLSTAPIITERDGDFHCIALMDLASGFLIGMHMVPLGTEDELGAAVDELLKGARSRGLAAHALVMPESALSMTVAEHAATFGMIVGRAADAELAAVLEEPRAAFADRFGGQLQ
jgi:hypothetical protein